MAGNKKSSLGILQEALETQGTDAATLAVVLAAVRQVVVSTPEVGLPTEVCVEIPVVGDAPGSLNSLKDKKREIF